jgi:hypothetical protein
MTIGIVLKRIAFLTLFLVLISSTFLATTSFNRVLAQQTPNVAILSYSSYVDSINYLHVVGEVKNMGAKNLEFVEITSTFYNKTGTVIDVEFTSTMVDILAPNKTSPFDVSSSRTSNIYSYRIDVSGQETNDLPYRFFQIISSSSYIDSIGNVNVVGIVKNMEPQILTSIFPYATFVKIIATFYDKNGTVVQAGFTYSIPSTLRANQTAPFKLIVNQVNNIDHFNLQVQCKEYLSS